MTNEPVRPHGLLAAFVLLLLALVATVAAVGRPAIAGANSRSSVPSTCEWSLVPSSNVDVYNSLDALAPVAPDNAWALGASGQDDPSQATLIEHWDGASWSVVSSPSPGDMQDKLLDAAVLSPTDIWAVGYYNGPTGGTTRSLTMHWDGNSWSVIPSPNPGALGNELHALAAVSANDIWAFGTIWAPPSPLAELILHWDGASWSAVELNGPGSLASAAFTSSADVWAVGNGVGPSGYGTLVLHWDGNTWSTVPSPNVAGENNYLSGIAAISSDDAWAVGYACVNNCLGGGPTTRPLTIHWDGTAWSIVPTPDLGEYSVLYGVEAVSTGDVWAVGNYTSGTQGHDLLLHWDGTAWSVVQGSDPDSCCPELHAIAKAPDGELWTVGNYHFPGNPVIRTQVQHYPACSSGTVTPVPPSSTRTSTITPSRTTTPPATTTQTATAVAIPSETPTATATATAIATASATHTATPVIITTTTPIATRSPTYTPCAISFSDVHPADYFYNPVTYLYCHGAISGYSDGTFRPYNSTTRGQLSKIVVLAEGWQIDLTGAPHFSDVPAGSTFYPYVETAYNHRVISGYSDGTFRWGSDVTRGQLTKILVLAEGWPTDLTGAPHFSDVPPDSPFYAYVETAFNHQVISGYSDSTFHPGNNATRGQISKIVYLAISGGR